MASCSSGDNITSGPRLFAPSPLSGRGGVELSQVGRKGQPETRGRRGRGQEGKEKVCSPGTVWKVTCSYVELGKRRFR